MNLEGRNLPTAKAQKSKRPFSQIDVVSDVFRRIKKEMGMYNFIPLSTGRLQDLWWRPTQVFLLERARGTGVQEMNIRVQILMDSCPVMMNPSDTKMEAVLRTDANEVIKVSFLMDRLLRVLHSERGLTYAEWFRAQATKFKLADDECNPLFAKQVMDEVLAQAVTRVPESFLMFICKKPTLDYGFPPGCTLEENQNSVSCTGKNDLKYEFRIRFFIVEEVYHHDDEDGEEASPSR